MFQFLLWWLWWNWVILNVSATWISLKYPHLKTGPYLFYEDSAGPAGKTLDVPLPRLISSPSLTPSIPMWSMGLVQYIDLYTFIWLIFMVNGGKYTIPMDPTWKIIPVSKWFISMVRFCPLRIRLFPLQLAFLWLINGGDPYQPHTSTGMILLWANHMGIGRHPSRYSWALGPLFGIHAHLERLGKLGWNPKNPDPSRSNRIKGSNPILRIGM